ncbi:MAG: hypothetical protein LC112_11105 [Flavobacteriales bacterium]|nr:hypothetical protein [Flavobacteriales bacterium]
MPIITKKDCASSVTGTGQSGCRKIKGYVARRFLIEKGYKFDKLTDSFDDATINALIQQFKLIPLPTDLGAEAQNQDTTFETIQKQDIYVSGMVYGWNVMYPADSCLSKALKTLSAKRWDLLEVDEDGNLIAVETTDGFLKGFDTNMVRYMGLTNNDGSVGSKVMLRIQLSKNGSSEYDSQWQLIESGEVDWLNLQGVDELLFTKVGGKLKVTYACDESTPIEGLTTAKVRAVDSSGAVVAGFTIAADGEGLYTVSGLTSGDYLIYTYDAVSQSNTVIVGNYFYKSNKLTWTV